MISNSVVTRLINKTQFERNSNMSATQGRVSGPEDDVKLYIVDILKDLHEKRMRSYRLDKLVSVYLTSNDYKYGRTGPLILNKFRQLPAIKELEDYSNMKLTELPMIAVIDSTMNQMTEEQLAFNEDRLIHLTNMLSAVSDCIERTIQSHENLLQGYSMEEDRILIPTEISAELRNRASNLTYKSVWAPIQNERNRRGRETRKRNMERRLQAIKRKPVDLTSAHCSLEQYNTLKNKMHTITDEQMNKMLTSRNVSTQQQGQRIYALKNGAVHGQVWRPRNAIRSRPVVIQRAVPRSVLRR